MPDDKTGDGVLTVEKLAEQVENLNKGIATYRDKVAASEKVSEAATAKATAAEAKVAELTKLIEEAAGDDDDKKPKVQPLAPKDEERLAAWAKERGFVTKAEMDAERTRVFNEGVKNVESQAITEFISNHPEYDDEIKWKEVQKEFNQYRQPTSITGYRQLLNKIHKELKGSDDAAARARAEIETRKRLGLGGGNGSSAEEDTTMEDLQERYPNLSREQIAARLEEINQLTESRKKGKKK